MYRAKIMKLRNMLSDLHKVKDETLIYKNPAELIAEGIEIVDSLPRISKDDTLILQSECICPRKETITTIQEEIKKRTGMNVALFDGRTKIIGVVEHGT